MTGAELVTPERARSTFRHPENADLAQPAVEAVARLADIDDDVELEACS